MSRSLGFRGGILLRRVSADGVWFWCSFSLVMILSKIQIITGTPSILLILARVALVALSPSYFCEKGLMFLIGLMLRRTPYSDSLEVATN